MDETSIHDLFEIWRRRKVAYFLTAAGLLLLALILAFSWSRYQSKAIVQIQQPDIPESMTAPSTQTMAQAIRAIADQRIEQIQEKVVSAATLVDIITKFDLYPEDRAIKPIEAVVKTMRKKIKLELLTGDEGDGSSSNPTKTTDPNKISTIAFSLQFTYSNPLTAQHVANELVSRFLDEDLKLRRTQAQATTAFMEAQIEALDATMVEQEKKIGAFRAKHPDSRPEELALNQQLAASTFQSLQSIEANLTAVDRNRGDLRTQLVATDAYSRVIADGQMITTPAVQLRALQAKYSTLIAQYSIDHPDVVRLRHQIESLQREVGQTPDTADLAKQVTDARANLAAAESTYGLSHPDVIALKHEVANLENRLALAAADPTDHAVIKKDADNPAYLMLKQQLESADSQYKSLQEQRDMLRKQYEHYQQIIAGAPALEQEYAALARDYDNVQLRYRELKEKKMSADMTEQMEQGRKAERLIVVDPPDLPDDTAPKRILLLAGGIVFSVFGGFGGVVLAEMLSRSVHGARKLEQLTGLIPLIVVPHIFTEPERQMIRRRRIRYGSASAVAALVLIYAFSTLVMPLDVFWSVLLHRLGIA
jgi:uncharacterized protein involved in exopolysaccharide biosynthesis